MSDLRVTTALPVEPGLCGACRHALVKGTNRGTAYLRCTRAAWDASLDKYPRLPVTGCVGFEPASESPVSDNPVSDSTAQASGAS